jgi:hypothetical protein
MHSNENLGIKIISHFFFTKLLECVHFIRFLLISLVFVHFFSILFMSLFCLSTSTSTSSLPHQHQAYQDHHPGLRNKPGLMQKPAGSVDEALDRNLDDMASGLARLKGLAQGLNSELSDHNQILDRVTDKTEVVGFKVDKQNKDMNKILKK